MNTPFHYECTQCHRKYERDEVTYLCPDCSGSYRVGQEPLPGVLEVVFDYDSIRKHWDPAHPDWQLFCCVPKEFHPQYAVGGTPLVPAQRLGDAVGFSNVLVKFDGLNPSGSLKDRASFLVVAEALRLGERRVVCASTGNAASALAAVCAAAGIQAIIFCPATAPRAKLVSMVLYGATVVTVKGTYDDAFRLSLEYSKERGGLNRNTAYHPLTIEGKKTVALEIYEQLGMRAPDAVLVPVGDGVIIGGVFKGFLDLQRAGLISQLPRIVGVQASRSNAIEHLYQSGKYENAADPSTVADSISVAAPANAYMAVRAMKETNGFPVLVTDDEILEAQALLSQTTGIFAEPAGSVGVAALTKCRDLLDRDSCVVVLATGHGLKDIDAPLSRISVPEAIEPVISAVPADL